MRERARCVAAALAQWSRAAAELGLRAAWAEAEQRRAHCAEENKGGFGPLPDLPASSADDKIVSDLSQMPELDESADGVHMAIAFTL